MYKLLLVLLLFAWVNLGHSQNRISIKKKSETSSKNELAGFYYSNSIIQERRNSSGFTSYKEVKYYLYISDSKRVFLFTSPLSPEKAYKKFAKKREAITDEIGKYTQTDNSLYLTMNTTSSNRRRTYRYVGEISDSFLYLNYKAAHHEKTALNIYLYKLEE